MADLVKGAISDRVITLENDGLLSLPQFVLQYNIYVWTLMLGTPLSINEIHPMSWQADILQLFDHLRWMIVFSNMYVLYSKPYAKPYAKP